MAAACVEVSPEHRCASTSDCTLDDAQGRCEPTGNCSFPDATCGANGYRYHDRAGVRADICVVPAVDPTGLLPFDLRAASDRTRTSCAPIGAREVMIELDSPAPQLLFVDTPTDNGARPVIAIREGACPGGAEVGCALDPCGPISYGHLLVGIGPGKYCAIVEQAEPASDVGAIALRVLPAGRGARVLVDDMATVPPGMPDTSTCDQPPSPPPSCGSVPAPAAMFVRPRCPGPAQLSFSVDPVDAGPLDAIVAVHASIPTGVEVNASCKNTASGQLPETVPPVSIPGPDLYWIAVMSTDPNQCGPFSLSYSITP
jgi:hypothetical protein